MKIVRTPMKRTYAVACICEGELIKRWTMTARGDQLVEQLRRYFPGAKLETAYEAGFSGFALHRVITKAGIVNKVVHAASVEIASRNRVKTDKRDAVTVAKQLAAGRLGGIHVPEEKEESARMLTRTRDQLVQQRTRCRNQIRMKLHQLGLIDPEDKRELTLKFVEFVLERNVSPELISTVKSLMTVWKTLNQEIHRLEKELAVQALKDPCEEIYRSAPGFGALSARVLSNELGDMSQFANERQLYSYTGLTPTEYSSGDDIRRGHISRQGNSRLQHILVEAAWRAIKEDRELAVVFERLYPRIGKKRAIVAVARRLIGRIRACLRKKEFYYIAPSMELAA